MGVQIFPVLEGYDKYHFLHSESLNWKSIPSVFEKVQDLARKIGAEPLGHFVNSTREDMPFDEEDLEAFERDSEFIDGVYYFQGSVMWSIEPQWFDTAQGLETVQRLLDTLRGYQEDLSDGEENLSDDEKDWADDFDSVISELEVMAGILERGRGEGHRFRLCVSG